MLAAIAALILTVSATPLPKVLGPIPVTSDSYPFMAANRSAPEFDLAKVNGSTLIPLATLPQSLAKLNRDAEIIAICHHGMRSADATNFLLQQGYSNVKNLVGGIDAWSAQVDRSVPRY